MARTQAPYILHTMAEMLRDGERLSNKMEIYLEYAKIGNVFLNYGGIPVIWRMLKGFNEYYSIYIFPCRKIEMRSQNPMIPAPTNPTIPIIGTSFHKGGILERTIKDEPIMRAARTMAKAIRLLI